MATVGALAIAGLTLLPSGSGAEQTSPLCVICGPAGGVDFTLNLLLYVPFGAGLGAMALRWRNAAGVVFIVSLGIELLQIGVISGRDASLGDLVANTLGGIIGIWIGSRWRSLAYPSAARSLRLARSWGVLWLVTVAVAVWASGIDIPEPPWWAQLALKGNSPETFRGSVLQTRIGGIGVSRDSLVNAPALGAALRDGAEASVVAVIPGPTPAPSAVFAIVDSNETEVFALGQDARDGVFHVQTRASAMLALRNPSVRLPGAFASGPGDTVRLTGRRTRSSLRITAERRGSRVTRTLQVSPQWAWTFFLPFEYSLSPSSWRIMVFWIAALIFPLGYWVGRACCLDRRAAGLGSCGLLAGVAVAGLGALPILGGLHIAALIEWDAWVAGVAFGAMAGWLSVPRTQRRSLLSFTQPRVLSSPVSPSWRQSEDLL
ncbi:MAG: VanZ family protein [Gemmatimonadaceae bacterium]